MKDSVPRPAAPVPTTAPAPSAAFSMSSVSSVPSLVTPSCGQAVNGDVEPGAQLVFQREWFLFRQGPAHQRVVIDRAEDFMTPLGRHIPADFPACLEVFDHPYAEIVPTVTNLVAVVVEPAVGLEQDVLRQLRIVF